MFLSSPNAPFSSLSCTTTERGSSTASPSAGGSRAPPCSSSLHTGLSAFCLPLLFVYFKLLFVYLHTCSKDDPSWKPPSLSTPLLAEDLDRPSYSTLPAPKALNIHAKNKKVGLYFIFLRILDVLSYTVPHSINMTWRSIIDIFFCRAANRRSWCSTRWRSASLKSSPSSSRPPTSALWRRAPARKFSIRYVRYKYFVGHLLGMIPSIDRSTQRGTSPASFDWTSPSSRYLSSLFWNP